MAAVDDILQSLPVDQIAQQVGAQPQEVEQAAQQALPALLGGLQANAQGGGASSILDALGQHDNDLLQGGVNLDQVDTADGQKIASNIFGANEEQVYSALGSNAGGGASSALIKKLIPILAPIVLSYLANKVLKGGGGGLGGGTAQQAPAPADNSGQGGPGSLDSMLQDVLGGALGGGTTQTQQAAQQQAPQQTQPSVGGSVLDILGGLLGGGRR
ncbi:uncharacterized protein DUF937 [Knoellia remsis]|uniref:Uncharacterized protein DUF937 n=1 Tax=Knoellia remsis TaxID=407159 RepID=A0A2T0UTS1_9MICO|nr:DUF937 domain-containing protein [Knoellia remsis]PRY61303.1 uncharacterized protein DUF937 [Knoellia remsis]